MEEFITDNIYDRISSLIKDAKKKIKIAVAWFEFSKYEEILISARKRGVLITIIVDDNQSNRRYGRNIKELTYNDITVKFLKLDSYINHMHEKIAIIDCVGIIGSFNWTENATKNFENIFITDSKKIVDEINKEIDEIDDYCKFGSQMQNKQNGVVNMIIYEPDITHGGTEVFNVFLAKARDNSNELFAKDLLFTSSDDYFMDVESDYDHYRKCIELLKDIEVQLEHSIDGILEEDLEQLDSHDGFEFNGGYKLKWKNRITNCCLSRYFDNSTD